MLLAPKSPHFPHHRSFCGSRHVAVHPFLQFLSEETIALLGGFRSATGMLAFLNIQLTVTSNHPTMRLVRTLLGMLFGMLFRLARATRLALQSAGRRRNQIHVFQEGFAQVASWGDST